MQELLSSIERRTAQVAVIGAGYVGLPLAVEAAQAGFRTIAFDVSASRVASINRGESYIGDVPNSALGALIKTERLRATTDAEALRSMDAVIVCVPTPLNKTKDPDISAIMSAAETLLPRLRRRQVVVLESTTYPGFTREVLQPYLERTGLKAGKDFYLAFSPERVDPGNANFQTKNTPKVVGGTTNTCTEIVTALYQKFIANIVPVSSCDAAEMVKLLENTFRAVNIGLVNEVAIMCKKLGIDTWEVIDAAATKPFGFMPFYPGPGLGGHCIPIDPHYLSWKLRTLNYQARFIELAGVINSAMPELVVQLVADALNEREKAVKGSQILVLGVAYKANIDDMRESPALDVIELLAKRGAVVEYHDPRVPELRIADVERKSVGIDRVKAADCVVIVTAHSTIDYSAVCEKAKLVIDTRNATKGVRAELTANVVKL